MTRIMTKQKCQKQDGNKKLSEHSQELFNMKSMEGKAREDIIWLKVVTSIDVIFLSRGL